LSDVIDARSLSQSQIDNPFIELRLKRSAPWSMINGLQVHDDFLYPTKKIAEEVAGNK
jgi:hypothetical protein